MSHEQEQDGAAIYRRLLSYVRPYWSGFIFTILAMVVVAASEPAFAALMKPMLDGSFVERDPQAIASVPLLLISLFIVRGIATFASTYGMAWVGRGVVRDLRLQMFQHLLTLPTKYYDASVSGKLLAKFSFDVELVAQAASNALTILVRDTLTIIGLLGWMFYLNWKLASIFLLLGPLITIIVVVISRRFRKITRRIQASMGDVTHVAQEAIDGHRVIKIFGGQQTESAQFSAANMSNRSQNLKLIATTATSVSVMQLLAASALAVIIYIATMDSVMDEQLSVGTFMSFITAMLLLLPPLKRVTTIHASLQQGISAARSVFAMIDQPVEEDLGRKELGTVEGRVEYHNVCFSYDAKKGQVLDKLSFTVEPGKVIAFVGASGSGKSTIANLLPRFYEVDDGEILLDGIDIREIKRSDLRSHIALVSQDIMLFNDNVRSNIAYGALEGASEEAIQQAMKAAHVEDFVNELPEGLETMVGQNGVQLSGGQRQRIAIARALLKDAPILILDEATSALDTESERHIQAALDALMQHRTTLVIAHRLSTIENADQIIVLDKGQVIESGNHTELLAKEGHYAKLYQLQFHDQ